MIKLLAVSALLATLVFPGSQDAQAGAVIRIWGTTTAIEFVDIGRPGHSAGDEMLRGVRLTDKYDRIIGSASFGCVNFGNAMPGVSLCTAVFNLPKGKIVVQGTRRTIDYYLLPVTGGTGIYSHASGSLLGETVSKPPRKDRLLFSLEY